MQNLVRYPDQYSFTKNSRNVMELLVVEELEKQLKSLHPKTVQYIKPCEVIAYALNRLPALYATSNRGWQRQLQRGKTELHEKIATAVRQGIAAVQRDPLRSEDSLIFQEEDVSPDVPQVALQKLRLLLQVEDLSWDNLANVVEKALISTLRGRITWRRLGLTNQNNNETFNWERNRL